MYNYLKKGWMSMDIYKTRYRMKYENVSFMNLPLRVVYYARVSTDMMQQINSLDNQVQFFTTLIGNNENWEFVNGYVDEGLSGISTEKREQFNKMIADAKAGMFDLVVTKEVSRFARNTLDSIRYTRELLNAGVVVLFQSDGINTIEEDSEVRLGIMASMAQDESRKISNRVRFGHHQAIKSGVVLGNSQIYGYKKQDKKLVIDEEQAPMIRELFEKYASGAYSVKALEQLFWEQGYRNTKGKRISHSTLGNIITNPKYKGYYCGNKVIIRDMFTKKQQFLPEDEWVMYKDETGEIVPAIVSEDIWDEANRIFKIRSEDVKKRQNKTIHPNLLTGKLICAHCGTPYYRKDSKRKDGTVNSTWRCSNKINNGKDVCPSCSIYEYEIIPVIEDVFAESKEIVNEYAKIILDLIDKVVDDGNQATRVSELSNLINLEQNKIQKIFQYNVEGVCDDDDAKKMISECKEKISTYQTELSLISDKMKGKGGINEEIENVKSFLEQASRTLKDSDIDRSFIDMFIDKILVKNEENRINLEIYLKNGQKLLKVLDKVEGRPVQILNVICPIRTVTYNRNNRNVSGHNLPLIYEFCLAV